MIQVKDLRILKMEKLITPNQLLEKYPVDDDIVNFVSESRKQVNDIICGRDRRLLAIVGPCSIHNIDSALEYGQKLKKLSEKVNKSLFIVMRTYFEKPRTIDGWKGLIVDPNLDGSYQIEKGLEMARKLLLELTKMKLPLGCEVLDPIVPQYIDDLISWASIGARTSESQVHRSLASGLSTAVGFKNSTNGNIRLAVNAIKAASLPSSFIGINRQGIDAVMRTTGNECGHLILRGGSNSPNYYEDDVKYAVALLKEAKLNSSIVIDCSHGNSRKQSKRQPRVLSNLIDQVRWGQQSIKGFMIESNLFDGAQKIVDPKDLEYGVSVTDACMGWEQTEALLIEAAEKLFSCN